VIPFQRFLDEQRDVVWRFSVASVGRQDADDVFQETFISALRAYPKLRDESNLRAWVFTIARRKAVDHSRAKGRRAIPSDALPEQAAPPAPLAQPELWDAVGELPPRMRAAVWLRYAGDLTHRDIARVMDSSEDAARKSVSDGLRKLKEALA
jgi:RNA polymerase sigma factor (sigma-70 family)